MFLCRFCNKSSLPGEPRRLVPVEVRRRIYREHQKEIAGAETVIEEAQCPRCAGAAATPVAAVAGGTAAVVSDPASWAGRAGPPGARPRSPIAAFVSVAAA